MKLKKDGTPSQAGRPKVKEKAILIRPTPQVAEILGRQDNKTDYIERAVIELDKQEQTNKSKQNE